MYQQSNKQLSGKFVHLNGKRIAWEENFTYGDPNEPWVKAEGKIVRVASNGSAYWISNEANGRCYWLDAKYGQYRNIHVF
jgi:hypothetical protein